MKPFDMIKKYHPESSDAYRILVTHDRSVTDKALALAHLYPEMDPDLTFIEKTTMLHDIRIFLCNAPDTDRHGKVDYICHGYLGADSMRKEGYPRHALVCKKHTGTGFSLTMIGGQNLPVPYRDVCPVLLEEQPICFADKFFSEIKLTKEKPADEIKQSLSKYRDETVEQFEHWCKLFLGE